MDFIVKQALGGATKDLNKLMDDKNVDPKQAEAEKEQLEALAEQEAERKAKHVKREAEREIFRQTVRDKYGLKTKSQIAAEQAAARDEAIQRGLSKSSNTLSPNNEEDEDAEEGDEEESLISQAQKAFGEIQQKMATAKESASESCKVS